MHTNTVRIFNAWGVNIFRSGDRVLEIGPDALPSTLETIVRSRFQSGDLAQGVSVWDTIDIAQSTSGRPVDPYHYPLADESYSVIVSANVIEHIPEPWTWLRELRRLLPAGGRIITICPVSWPFHEAPVDCWRMYPAALEALYKANGFAPKFSWWGSLEDGGEKKYQIPGRSADRQHREHKLPPEFNERAYDTLVIGEAV